MKDAYLHGGGVHDAVSQYTRIAVRPDGGNENDSTLDALNELRASVGIQPEITNRDSNAGTGSSAANPASRPEDGDVESGISKMLMRVSRTSVSKSPFLVPGAVKNALADAIAGTALGTTETPKHRPRKASFSGEPAGDTSKEEAPVVANPVWQKRRIGPDSDEEAVESSTVDLTYFSVVGKNDDVDDDDSNLFFGEVSPQSCFSVTVRTAFPGQAYLPQFDRLEAALLLCCVVVPFVQRSR